MIANGDTGIANRTTSGKVRVMVTGSNSAPSGVSEIAYTISENDDEDNTMLMKPGGDSAVVADLTGLITDPEGTTITYSVKGDGDVSGSAAPFGVVSGSSLVVDQAVANATPAVEDDADTDGDESVDAIPPTGGTCTDDTAADGCGNIQFVFKVNASDGVSSNDQEVEVTVTIDVNDAVVLTDAIADTLSTATDGVSYGGEDDVVGVKVHPHEVNSDQRDVTIIPVSMIVVNDDGDDLTYTLEDSTNTFRLDTSTGRLSLPYAPRDSGNFEITITVDDGYNDADNDELLDDEGDSFEPVRYEPDLTINVKVELEVVTPVRDYPVISKNVPENMPTGADPYVVIDPDDTDDAAALASISQDETVSYAHVGGLGAGALDANNPADEC